MVHPIMTNYIFILKRGNGHRRVTSGGYMLQFCIYKGLYVNFSYFTLFHIFYKGLYVNVSYFTLFYIFSAATHYIDMSVCQSVGQYVCHTFEMLKISYLWKYFKISYLRKFSSTFEISTWKKNLILLFYCSIVMGGWCTSTTVTKKKSTSPSETTGEKS